MSWTWLLSVSADQQESRAMAGKPHDAVVKFHTYRNFRRHRAVLPATARLSYFRTTFKADMISSQLYSSDVA